MHQWDSGGAQCSEKDSTFEKMHILNLVPQNESTQLAFQHTKLMKNEG